MWNEFAPTRPRSQPRLSQTKVNPILSQTLSSSSLDESICQWALDNSLYWCSVRGSQKTGAESQSTRVLPSPQPHSSHVLWWSPPIIGSLSCSFLVCCREIILVSDPFCFLHSNRASSAIEKGRLPDAQIPGYYPQDGHFFDKYKSIPPSASFLLRYVLEATDKWNSSAFRLIKAREIYLFTHAKSAQQAPQPLTPWYSKPCLTVGQADH